MLRMGRKEKIFTEARGVCVCVCVCVCVGDMGASLVFRSNERQKCIRNLVIISEGV